MGSVSRPTRRQLEVLQLVAKGMGREEIARKLVISPFTVKAQLEYVRKRTATGTVTQCIVACIARGYLLVDDIDECLDIVPERAPIAAVPEDLPDDSTGDGEDEPVDHELVYTSHPDAPSFADVDVEVLGPERLSLRHG
jgi:DNA-binding CsgD family transcriptional regulator